VKRGIFREGEERITEGEDPTPSMCLFFSK
jgi:hypothetical protein